MFHDLLDRFRGREEYVGYVLQHEDDPLDTLYLESLPLEKGPDLSGGRRPVIAVRMVVAAFNVADGIAHPRERPLEERHAGDRGCSIL